MLLKRRNACPSGHSAFSIMQEEGRCPHETLIAADPHPPAVCVPQRLRAYFDGKNSEGERLRHTAPFVSELHRTPDGQATEKN